MSEVIDVLFLRTWWRYTVDDNRLFNGIYHWFNIVEGCIWLTFAALVFRRYVQHRSSRLELWYLLAFFTFGISDFREAWAQSSWLLWLKLLNLIGLLWLRRMVMSRYYPTAKVY